MHFNKKDTIFIHEIAEMFLIKTQDINTMMLTALSGIATEKANPTIKTLLTTKQFLDYTAKMMKLFSHTRPATWS